MILLLACIFDDDGSIKRGEAESGPLDSAEENGGNGSSLRPDDSDAPKESEGETAEETDPPPMQVCYPGEREDWTTCLPVIPYDSAWGSDYNYPAPYQGSSQYLAPVRFLDIDAQDPDLMLAPNFALSEFLSSAKGPYGVLQGPFLARMQTLRDAVAAPVYVTSGFRSPGYNAGIGGAEYSRHMYGDAADIDVSGWTVEEVGEACVALDAGYVGLYEDGHTHCDWRDDDLDPAFFDVANGPVPPPPSRATLQWVAGRWTAPAEGFDEGEPFRRWRAFDADGRLLVRSTGREFVPPPRTAELQVVVGGQVELRQTLP